MKRLYSGKTHASGVLLFVRTLEVATLVIREWQEKLELAVALGPKEVLSNPIGWFLLLYGAHKGKRRPLSDSEAADPRRVNPPPSSRGMGDRFFPIHAFSTRISYNRLQRMALP